MRTKGIILLFLLVSMLVGRTQESFYKEAENYLAKRNYPKARKFFILARDASVKGSLTDDAAFYAAKCLQLMDKYSKAAEEFKDFVAKNPKSDYVDDALYEMGVCYEEAGKIKLAYYAYWKVTDFYPRSEAARDAKARAKARHRKIAVEEKPK